MLIYGILFEKKSSFYDYLLDHFVTSSHGWKMFVTVATVINPGHGWQTSKTVVYRGLT